MTLRELLVAPFADEGMRRALVGTFALSLSAPAFGVILMVRRMSLMGDAMSHAILPGVAIAFFIAGLNPLVMTAGGLAAGLMVALLSGGVARRTELKEDASLAAFFFISLAAGVTIVSLGGSTEELLHFLFGNVLAIAPSILILLASITTITTIGLALIIRPLVIECVDPQFFRSVSRAGGPVHLVFMAMVVLVLVGGFHALGTLLTAGMMLLPAATARFWTRDLTTMLAIATGTAVVSGAVGLLVAFHAGLPAGPAVILAAGGLYLGSVLTGPVGGLFARAVPRRHLEA